MRNVDRAVDEVIGLYASQGGSAYIGEPVTQLQHAAQTADLARGAGHDDEVVCAAFLHDIGHLCPNDAPRAQMGEFGVAHHERIGAEYLRALGFSNRVAHLVGQHVNAKRYLTHAHPDYYARLSEASKRTLEYQGGPMTADEARAFEADPAFELILQLRRWDEAAKVEDLPVFPLQRYGELIRAHLHAQSVGVTTEALLNAAQLAFWRAHKISQDRQRARCGRVRAAISVDRRSARTARDAG